MQALPVPGNMVVSWSTLLSQEMSMRLGIRLYRSARYSLSFFLLALFLSLSFLRKGEKESKLVQCSWFESHLVEVEWVCPTSTYCRKSQIMKLFFNEIITFCKYLKFAPVWCSGCACTMAGPLWPIDGVFNELASLISNRVWYTVVHWNWC